VLERLVSADEEEIFDTIFQRNWNDLLRGDDYAKRVLMTMTFFSATASKDAIEAGSDVHHAYLRAAIKRLIELSLLDVSQELDEKLQRFQLHTLARAFIRKEMKKAHEIGVAINERLIVFFLQCAETWSDTYIDIQNIHRMDVERVNLLEFATSAYDIARENVNHHHWEVVLRYANAMSTFLWGRGYWNDRLRLCKHAIEAASFLNDNLALGRQLSLIGRVHLWRGNISLAQEYANRSKNAMGSTENLIYLSIPMRLEAQIATQKGDYEQAEMLLNEVLQVASPSPDDDGRAATLIELGIVAERQAKLEIARKRFEEALRLDEQLGTIEGQAVSLSHLANVVLGNEDHTLAKQLFERGLILAKKVDRLSTVGRCQIGLARIHLHSSHFEEAYRLANAAEESFRRLGIEEMVEEAGYIASHAVSELGNPRQ
jgi:tetratricopeptide (TPR) repeat protein